MKNIKKLNLQITLGNLQIEIIKDNNLSKDKKVTGKKDKQRIQDLHLTKDQKVTNMKEEVALVRLQEEEMKPEEKEM